MDSSALLKDLQRTFPAAKAQEPMSRHTTWGIGGPADYYVEVDTFDALRWLVLWARENQLPLRLMGAGSNVLVSDKGLRGVVARLRGAFEEIRFEDNNQVWVGAGVPLPQLSRACAEHGLTGAEPFAGIPGTLGGGLLTNAGTPEGELGGLVLSVEVLTSEGERRVLSQDALDFDYRRSNLGGSYVLSARLQLKLGDKTKILAAIDAQLKRRADRQPLGTKNCGSVFINPPGDHAARLIEAVGLKGLQVGGARVSTKHANFIENVDKATAAQVMTLISTIRRAVQDRFGILLELEVSRVGEE
jgi:UDP-N-acetylmuramate dehydrogenase